MRILRGIIAWVHSRRARPTLRLLREDLADGWESPGPLRSLASANYDALHPVSELPHPIITKAAESFGVHAAFNGSSLLAWPRESIGTATISISESSGEESTGDPTRWLPTPDDERLLKQETAARLITEWEIVVQVQMLDALRKIQTGGSTRIDVAHPHPDVGQLAQLTVTVTPVREPGYEADEIELEVVPARSSYAGSHLLWQLTIRALISLSPPEQSWDRYKDSYTNIAEPGTWTTRVAELEALTADRELAESAPGQHSHYTHRRHLAGRTIEG